jgi:FixJ family two-component response regulator
MKAGAIEFLTKPVHHEVLLNAIHFAIGRGGTPRESIVFNGRA